MTARKTGGRSGRGRRRRGKTQTPAEREESTAPEAGSAPAAGEGMVAGPLAEREASELAVLRQVLDIEMDGDWEKGTMSVALDRLEQTMERILTRTDE